MRVAVVGDTDLVDEHMPALQMVGLRKVFGDHAAVKRVDLTVPPGSLYGLLGPNGAGKTTTLSMAVGLLRPDAGRSPSSGRRLARPLAGQTLMGVLPDGLALPEQLTGRELLGSWAGSGARPAHGRRARRRAARRARPDRRSERTLSSTTPPGCGRRSASRRRCCTARGCWSSTSRSRRSTRSRRRRSADPPRFVAGGGSVLLSSHVMALVEQLCDTVAVLARVESSRRARWTRSAGSGRWRRRSSSWSAGPRRRRGAVVVGVLIRMKLMMMRRTDHRPAGESYDH